MLAGDGVWRETAGIDGREMNRDKRSGSVASLKQISLLKTGRGQ